MHHNSLAGLMSDLFEKRYSAISIILISCFIAPWASSQESPKLPDQSVPVRDAPATPSGKGQCGAKYLATIIQSGSTNSRPYKVFIHADGSAMVQMLGRSSSGLHLQPQPTTPKPSEQHFEAGTVDTKTLRQLLREVGDVSKIPTGSCPKSVSFGTTTKISYAGKTSGDLQCVREDLSADADNSRLRAGQDLSKFVQEVLHQLNIHASPLLNP